MRPVSPRCSTSAGVFERELSDAKKKLAMAAVPATAARTAFAPWAT